MKKNIITRLFFYLGAIISLAYILFVILKLNQEEKNREDLLYKIANKITMYQDGTEDLINLSDIDLFSWDRLYIFGPYVPLDIIQKRLNFKWSPPSYVSVGSNDGVSLLIFVEEDEVVQFVFFPRDLGDFSEAGNRLEGYDRTDAVFKIEGDIIVWSAP
jgi:hypothetical protein